MSAYTITAVSDTVRQFETKFGPMVSYKLKLEGVDTPVELSQKTSTRPPLVTDVINGHIEETQFGLKFKKEQVQQGFGGGGGFMQQPSASPGTTSGGSSKSSASKFDSDPFTMYLSYAKDIAVALIAANKGVLDTAVYGEALETVITGGNTLYNSRPGAEPTKTTEPTDTDHLEAIKAFGLEPDADDKPISLSDIPF